ncbi:hypothetical protein U1Q18_019739 [Sarracenia purpurea var. burkii]
MTKSRWRESIKSLGSHLDPQKDEQLKKAKIEIDDKVAKIMKLIKNESQGSRDGEIVELVDDFQKQYKALSALYENLIGEIREKVHGNENESTSSTTSSDSESYYSIDEASTRSSPRNDLQKVRDDFKYKLETPGLEFADLRNKLTSMTEEKEALHSEYMASLRKIQESEKIIKELRIESEQTESTKQKLIKECTQLKEKLVEREKDLLSLTRAHQVHGSKVPTQIKELEREVSSLKFERKNLCTQKGELEGQIEGRAMEAKQLGEENSRLRSRILELERSSNEKQDALSAQLRKLEKNESYLTSKIEDLIARANDLQLVVDTLQTQKGKLEQELVFKSSEASAQATENIRLRSQNLELERSSKEKEDTLSALQRKLEENETNLTSKIEDLTRRANDLQLEVDSLRDRKGELEQEVAFESNRASDQVKDVMEQVNVLQQELHSLSSQKSESETTVEKLTQEISDFLTQIQNLKENLESKTMDLQKMMEENGGLESQVYDLELEVGHLRSQKGELEEQMRSKNHRADRLSAQNEELHVQISQLEKDSSTQIKAVGAELNNLQQDLNSLKTEKSQLELQNTELISKIAEHQTNLKYQEDVINKLNEENKQMKAQHVESKLNLQIAERKIEETAEEFCKKFEDSLRILSRRIRVAEQLHVENKDVSRKTREKYERENMELKERVTNTEIAVQRMKDISLTGNDFLIGLDTAALKFEECGGNFLNRISKASCEVLFAKDWVRRKNNAIKHVQEDVDCLLAQLDGKEAEVLGLREKVWKLENKARELEKVVKEKEEGMLGMGEEKREAIRQLCVWIDYHRSRSDYLKKVLSEMTVVRSLRPTP